MRYRLSGNRGFSHTFGFSAKNLSDKLYLTSSRTIGDRRSIYFTYSLGHR